MLRTNNHQEDTATSGVEKCILSQILQRHWFQFTLSHDCFARYPCQGGDFSDKYMISSKFYFNSKPSMNT
ncbi:hypothetical protein T10_7185 [Trichinella papuae]|uniref:Uncharacterized protein n=1 Tax=Trichinella papuae TaxID=268474 RepID=A0A0V1MFL7_9BILA|nr:hypothetical protein T10_7185 [Trichinella papuae]